MPLELVGLTFVPKLRELVTREARLLCASVDPGKKNGIRIFLLAIDSISRLVLWDNTNLVYFGNSYRMLL